MAAWSTPRDWTALELVTAANMDQFISDNLTYLGDLTAGGSALSALGGGALESALSEGARVYNDANISIPNSAATDLTFNQERFDDNALHDTGSNTERLTCKKTGKYIITGTVEFASNATGLRIISLNHYPSGGGGPIVIAAHSADAASAAHSMAISTVFKLTINDWATVSVFQSSGGALNVDTKSQYSPEFSMVRIGE